MAPRKKLNTKSDEKKIESLENSVSLAENLQSKKEVNNYLI